MNDTHVIRATVIVGDYSAEVTLNVLASWYGGYHGTHIEPAERAGYDVRTVDMEESAQLYDAVAAHLSDQRAEQIAAAMERKADELREELALGGQS